MYNLPRPHPTFEFKCPGCGPAPLLTTPLSRSRQNAGTLVTTLFFLTAAAAAPLPLASTRVCELSRKTARAGLAGGGGRLPKGALLPCVGQSTVSTIGIMGAQGTPPPLAPSPPPGDTPTPHNHRQGAGTRGRGPGPRAAAGPVSLCGLDTGDPEPGPVSAIFTRLTAARTTSPSGGGAGRGAADWSGPGSASFCGHFKCCLN